MIKSPNKETLVNYHLMGGQCSMMLSQVKSIGTRLQSEDIGTLTILSCRNLKGS